MRILALPRYTPLGAASRLRFFQYLPYLNANNIEVQFEPLLNDDYLNALYLKPIPASNVLGAYYKRIKTLLTVDGFDIVWIEKELLPWLPTWVERLLTKRKIPIIVDYDDATFHRYDQFPSYMVRSLLGKKIDHVMKRANVVVAGNQYLAQRAISAGAKRIEILPTVVDINNYTISARGDNEEIIIGWIGSRSTARYLHPLKDVMTNLSKEKKVKFISIGASPDQVSNLPIEAREWTEATEVEQLQRFDIGIMPLPDEPFERGKCGFKLIQYMACGKPVVASPIGVNRVIVNDGNNGYLAESVTDWDEKLRILIDRPELRGAMGKAGRRIVEESYSLQVAAPKLLEIFNSVI